MILVFMWHNCISRSVQRSSTLHEILPYHCFGSLRALFEEYQQDTSFISEKQNADSIYGNERTAKAVLVGSDRPELRCDRGPDHRAGRPLHAPGLSLTAAAGSRQGRG